MSSVYDLAVMPASLPTIENTIGSLFIGWGISAIVFGILCTQAWAYFVRFPDDSIPNKFLVSCVWSLEVAHQIVIGITCWHYSVSNFGSAEQAFSERTPWSLSTMVLLGAVIGTIVKAYFGLRVYRLSKGNFLWAGIICSMSIAQLGTATSYAIRSTHTAVSQLVTIKTLGTVSLSLGAATDIVTASVLFFYLRTMRTGYSRSDTLINRLISFSVNTGALTSFFSLAVVILYQLMPTNFVFIACYFIVCKLYSNSFLATLNSRGFSRGRVSDSESTPVENAFVMSPRSRLATMNGKGSQLNISIDVRREVSVQDEDEKTASKTSLARTGWTTTPSPSVFRNF